jgi:protein-ribulosamine 3-kinase
LGAGLQQHLCIDSARYVSGGCIHRCYEVRIGGARRFLKTNGVEYSDAFAAEADGLRALRDVGLRAPEPLAHGVVGTYAYLLLEFLELASRGEFAALGGMLGNAHRRPASRFGWARDNYIGLTTQKNAWCGDWAEFWMTRRLEPQVSMARGKGFDVAMPSMHLLKNHKPKPSLLHGDLWSGNAGFTKAGPVVFDPAVYYGDREADLAMTELFGGFPREFYRAYNETFPLDAGYEKRKHLYNLYHLLNHLNLFGGGYLGQVKSCLRLLGL